MKRIEKAFQRKAFIAYLTAGDPSLEATRDLVVGLSAAGADIIELGVPFSDPIADGPVIQRATERALRNGVTLSKVLKLATEIRAQTQVPLVLFSYFNPLFNYDLERLARDAAASGFDGVLATDLAVEESEPFRRIIQNAGLDTVFLVAPTSSPERMRKIAAASTGFLYAVSRTGVTGARQELSADLRDFLRTLRNNTRLPIAVGFGISLPEQVHAVWEEADGVIVGSAIVKEIEKHTSGNDLVERVAAFAKWLKG